MKYQIFIHNVSKDTYVGETSIRQQKEIAIRNLLKYNKAVKVVTICDDGTKYDGIIFAENVK